MRRSLNLSPKDIQEWEDKNRLINKITPYQLLGFIEGDGSFMIIGQSPCFSISQHLNSKRILETIENYFRNIPDQDIFQYKYNIPNSVVPFMQKSSSKINTSTILNYRIASLDPIYYYILPFFWYLNFQTRKSIDFRLWAVAVILIKRRIIKNTEDRKFLDKLHNSMNNRRYSNKIPSNFITLEEINYMLRLPSQIDLDSQYVSTIEASQKEKIGLSNTERALKVFIYDSHVDYLPVNGSPFPSQKAAARALLNGLGLSSASGLKKAIDTSKLYLGRFKITSTPWSPNNSN